MVGSFCFSIVKNYSSILSLMLVQCCMFEHTKVNEADVFCIFRQDPTAVPVILKCSHNFMQKNAIEVRF